MKETSGVSLLSGTVKLSSPDLLETVDLVIFPKSKWSGVFKVRNFVGRNMLVRGKLMLG